MISELYSSLTLSMTNPIVKFTIWFGLIILSVLVGLLAIKVILNISEKLLKKTKILPVAIPFTLAVLKILLYVLFAVFFVDALGMQTTSIVTALGAVGLAVSLAIKDSLSNLMGGAMLIISKTFASGDFVDIGGVSGSVHEIGMVHTVLITPDNKRICIPNGQVTNATVTNFSSQPTRRVSTIFTIDRSSDINTAKKAIQNVVDAHPLVLKNPAPSIRIEEHNDLGMEIWCKTWTANENYWDVAYDLSEDVKVALDKAGIVMPVRNICK